MNGTSGFQEVRSSTSRSPSYRYRFLHDQRHRFGTGAWTLLRTHELTARSAGISTRREKVPDTIYMPKRFECSGSAQLEGAP